MSDKPADIPETENHKCDDDVAYSIGELTEKKLAETLENEGYEVFQKELERTTAKTLKRGIPKGKYFIERITFDKYYEPDMELHNKLQELAKTKNMELNDYIKKEIIEPHVKTAA